MFAKKLQRGLTLMLPIGLATALMSCDREPEEVIGADPNPAVTEPIEAPSQPPAVAESPPAAREPMEQAQPAEQQPPAVGEQVSDQKLEAFGQVAPKIMEVQLRLQRDISGAKSPEEAQKLQNKARSQLDGVFAGVDLTAEEYATIAHRLQSDPELQRRFENTEAGAKLKTSN